MVCCTCCRRHRGLLRCSAMPWRRSNHLLERVSFRLPVLSSGWLSAQRCQWRTAWAAPSMLCTTCCCATACTLWARCRVRSCALLDSEAVIWTRGMCTVGQRAIHSSCRSRPLGIATCKSSPAFSPLLCCIPLCAVAVRHCLLALPGVEKGDIKRVLSHPQVCGGKMAAWEAGECGSTERCRACCYVAWFSISWWMPLFVMPVFAHFNHHFAAAAPANTAGAGPDGQLHAAHAGRGARGG